MSVPTAGLACVAIMPRVTQAYMLIKAAQQVGGENPLFVCLST